MQPHWLIVGCGDTGSRVARNVLDSGGQVLALVRSSASRDQLRQQSIPAHAIDLDEQGPPAGRFTHVLYAAPPPREGDDDPRLARCLTAVTAVDRFIYISTTGVYGDCNGEWVNEERRPAPQTGRAGRRVAAETRVQGSGLPWNILRAPGIYGPGRIPIERLRDGAPVLSDAQSPWTNRIHVADLAQAVLAVAARAPADRVYNVSDGQPTPMAAQYRELAALLGEAPPPEISWAEAQERWSEMRLSFLRDSRRVSSDRLRQDTGWSPEFSTLRDGLKDCLRQAAVR
ncbi:MAG: NAD(P)-dependent oxidoreductase [Salinisphaeraceae bacterium]|jgi:nucleoside-diphosphate-sugar epimerase|nr:NAD(P)-dependent oxidoreductase [Salinisphaeraceae bacterium]